jgi:hypothetical protein
MTVSLYRPASSNLAAGIGKGMILTAIEQRAVDASLTRPHAITNPDKFIVLSSHLNRQVSLASESTFLSASHPRFVSLFRQNLVERRPRRAVASTEKH